jgi:hypothetical protein
MAAGRARFDVLIYLSLRRDRRKRFFRGRKTGPKVRKRVATDIVEFDRFVIVAAVICQLFCDLRCECVEFQLYYQVVYSQKS